jgi:hypothetical protein
VSATAGSNLDLSAFSHLRVADAGCANAWLVRLPWLPWKSAAADAERRAVIDQLTLAFPNRSLWLTDLVTSAAPHWVHLRPEDDPYSAGDLYCGGWALFFFTAGMAKPSMTLDQLALDATSAFEQLRHTSAKAMVVSLVDDDEWIVAVDQ